MGLLVVFEERGHVSQTLTAVVEVGACFACGPAPRGAAGACWSFCTH